MNGLTEIKKAIQKNELEYSHFTLARFFLEQFPQASEFDLWLSVLVNLEISRGNVCLSIHSIFEKSRQLGAR